MEKQIKVFDVESFVEEIKERPAIWDYSYPDYNIGKRKKAAWTEIYLKVHPDYNDMPTKEQVAVGVEIHRRWKNMRQCFKREIDKRRALKFGSGRTWTTYEHFDALSFLVPVFAKKKTVSKSHDDTGKERSENERGKESLAESPQPGSSARRGVKRKSIERDHVEELSQVLIESLSERRVVETEEHDDDKHFLLSLLNSTKSVPRCLKLAMRTEIMQVVAKYCTLGTDTPEKSCQSPA
ncbi:uncharacterized protein LOC122398887 [Colletes gigas]|uniref:uncharacterized protein LOC122398887 n=1 Tax=Colletes gigas TaxID=935657 RepID=UPI001C9A957D|nr:uncharacterized protein LOC122398887 [Colletes gigas]